MSVAPGQLRWRSRRGVRELDLLLQGWLEHRYPAASEQERALFERFLALPDPLIADYLLGHARPSDPALARLVAQLSADRH